MNDDIDMSRSGVELFPEMQNSNMGVTNEPVAEAQPYNSGVTQQDVAGQQESEKEYNFRAIRDELAKMQSEREYWKGQAEALKTTPPDRFETPLQKEDPFKNLDEDVRGAFESMRQENERLKNEFRDQMAALNAKQGRSDWETMVTQHVPQLTSKNPIFAEMIRNASNPYEAAYQLAALSSQAQSTAASGQPMTNANAQRAISNAQKPQSLASVGGSATLSNADYYASMSDKDFMELAARNLSGI